MASAAFVSQQQQPSTTARSLERVSYLRSLQPQVKGLISEYYKQNPQGEQVTLAVIRGVYLQLGRLCAGRQSGTVMQDLGLFVPIVLSEWLGAKNVETYRVPESGRSSARFVPAAWSDMRPVVSRYTPHRITVEGLRLLRLTHASTEAAVPVAAVPWQSHIPGTRGLLPNGKPLRRTEASGPKDAKVMFLGVYPAATAVETRQIGGLRMKLPSDVERESFEPGSASGKELEQHYLAPLGLSRKTVLIADLMPYFLANVTKSASGRSMADNIRAAEAHLGRPLGIEARPAPRELVRRATSMPGNQERLQELIAGCAPRVLFTLGVEPAAFVTGEDVATIDAAADSRLYASPRSIEVLGVKTRVVHLVHPHLFIRQNAKWMKRHSAWIEQTGRDLVREALR